MTTVVVTPPDPFITLAEAKQHLRITDTDQDAMIQLYIAAACSSLDGPGGWLDKAVGQQVLRFVADEFPSAGDTLWVPFPPVISIGSVSYVDASGVSQTVASTVYQVTGVGWSRGGIIIASDQSWPSARTQSEAITVQYTAGYAPGNIPGVFKAAALLMVGDMFAHRETAVVGVTASAVPMSATVELLLRTHKVY